MVTLKIALRSFMRHRWRSAITTAAVALGLSMMLVFVGLADDTHARMAELGIRMGSGHVLIEAAGDRDNQTLDYVVHDADRIATRAAGLPNVKHVAERLRMNGLLAAGEHSAPALIAGVDPVREAQASDIAGSKARVAGAYLRGRDQMPFEAQPPDIYLGQTLAQQLAVTTDDRVVLTVSPPGDAEPTAGAFVVRGIFRTGVDDLDGGYAEIPIEEARVLAKLPGAATEVAVLSDLAHTAELTRALKEQYASRADLAIVPWQTALRELHEALVLDDAGLYLMMAVVFLVIAIGIFNTVLMSVIERTRDFGVMMALGTSGRRLCLLILSEACILAVVSVAVGLVLGLSVHSAIAAHGIDMTHWTGEVQFAGIAWSGRVYSQLSAAVVTRWTLVVAAVVLASSVYPALRVMGLEPVEAMRHV
jgi:ABC-type lipoprotein release transport system permease subunit